MGRIVGIDLGTTNSLVAVVERGDAHVIPNRRGERLTPSAVRIRETREIEVGQPALQARLLHPEQTITGIKRFMGRTYNEIADLAELVPFEVVPGSESSAVIRVCDRDYTPEQISSFILSELKLAAEAYLGEPVSDAVVTVPAYFNQPQRAATARAVELAGLTLKRLVAEPTAAALGYQISQSREKLVLVVDLGGGTYDVTLSEIGDLVTEVVAIHGDNHLGGDDFDRVLAEWVLATIGEEHGVDPSDMPDVQRRVHDAAREARHQLSFQPRCSLRLPFLFARDAAHSEETAQGPQAGRHVDVEIPLSLELFEDITEELFERLIPPMERALADAGKRPGDITEILLVGGATRMRRVSRIVETMFGRAPRKGVHPDEAVALGAAWQAGIIDGSVKQALLLDATHHSLAIEVIAGTCMTLIPRNTSIPTRKTETFSVLDASQTAVEIHIVEGERPLAVDNRTIGRLVLDLVSAPVQSQIEITLDIDARRRLVVSASELTAGGHRVELLLDYR